MLDNRLLAPYFPPAYYLSMDGIAFRDRVIAAMEALGMSKAELSRQSGVPYHAIDKFLKREGATTSTENAVALSKPLGLNVDDNSTYEELQKLFNQLDDEAQRFVLASVRGLIGQ